MPTCKTHPEYDAQSRPHPTCEACILMYYGNGIARGNVYRTPEQKQQVLDHVSALVNGETYEV